MEVVKFRSENIENVLVKMDEKQIDNLAFGAIQLDKDGVILLYNATESKITGRKPEDVIGRQKFFQRVAPCTRRPEFYGKSL